MLRSTNPLFAARSIRHRIFSTPPTTLRTSLGPHPYTNTTHDSAKATQTHLQNNRLDVPSPADTTTKSKRTSASARSQEPIVSTFESANQRPRHRPASSPLTPAAREQVCKQPTTFLTVRGILSIVRPSGHEAVAHACPDSSGTAVYVERASAVPSDDDFQHLKLDWMEPDVRERVADAVAREGLQKFLHELPYVEIWNPLVG